MTDQRTLYRINLNPNAPDYDDMDVEYWVSDTEGRDAGWLVPVEPTDRICIIHKRSQEIRDKACYLGVVDGIGGACVMVDVVQMEEGEEL